ncbi:hypothetical protein LH336_04260 [Leptospira borgpetersenii]|nr:hypothetical protein [Leptospira borgpetersenii]MBE8404230.1 hypothetical protein [Leptospira borgpetersenii serovar Tarassovi]MBE8413525.1 hypothetical protein [Leptospira borgpetersenii serovar Tarassovi]MBE8416903.1 hypothetical protein [Leptospira borgpetersenii serovar Tarassovi]MBE8435926.1 hypothetical protein [Leptospira borgpetersenii serovar Tarassovi]UVA64899.1 hypothetical protein LH336_04260 [Leptospira borgpetersenii]
MDTSIKSRSQNVGTIAAIREDSDKIEWFWDTLKIKKTGRYKKFLYETAVFTTFENSKIYFTKVF